MNITANMIPMFVALVGSIALCGGGLFHVIRKMNNGWILLLTGIAGGVWSSLRIIQKGLRETLSPNTLSLSDHYATLFAGAGIVLCVMLIIRVRKTP